jgi:hypothetical protein
VGRARRLHAAFEGLRTELVERLDAPGCIVIVHRQAGKHVGRLSTPLGELEPTGRVVEVLTIDVLRIEAGRVAGIWVVGDELGRLIQLQAVGLVRDSGGAGRASG